MKVVIPDDYQNAVRGLACYAKLKGHDVTLFHDTVKDLESLAARLGNAEALILSRDRTAITRELVARLPRLTLISQAGSKIAHVDVRACTERGVAVSVSAEDELHSVSELTWGLIIAAMRNIALEDRRLREGRWQTTIGQCLRGRVLGIFGFGAIGAMVAEIGKAFSMSVIVWGREGSLSRARARGFSLAASQQDLFERSDVLSLHVSLTPETRGIVRLEDLARMKTTALLVNTARAGVIADGALVTALRQGRPGRAAIDVFESEPLTDAGHPLLQMDNVTCTPHLGGVVVEKYEYFYGRGIDQVVAFAAGKPINIINPEALAGTASSR